MTRLRKKAPVSRRKRVVLGLCLGLCGWALALVIGVVALAALGFTPDGVTQHELRRDVAILVSLAVVVAATTMIGVVHLVSRRDTDSINSARG